MKKIYLITIIIFQFQLIKSQITQIPDTGFEKLLIIQGIDTDGTINGQVRTSDIANLTHLSIYNDSPNNIQIQSITGIEDFLALTNLQIFNVYVNNINLSNNIHIDTLIIKNLPFLNNINLQNNVNLVYLKFFLNGYINDISLNLNNCHNLKFLDCRKSNIHSLDLTNNTKLEYLFAGNYIYYDDDYIHFNNFPSVDLSNNNLLKFVAIENSGLSQIIFPTNSNIKELYLRKQNFSSFNTQNLQNLEKLNLAYNQSLSNIDLNYSQSLKQLNLSKCNLSSIDLNLLNLEDLMLGFFPDDPNLNHLHDNLINSIDLSSCPNLKRITAENIGLQNINITNNTNLEMINVSYNQNLSDIDISNNINLRTLIANKCNIQNINLMNNENLETLILGQNDENLDYSNYHSNNIQEINLNNNTNLKNLALKNINLHSIDLTNNSQLFALILDYNPINSLNLEHNPYIVHLVCSNTSLTSLDLSMLQNIETIKASNIPNLNNLNLHNNHNNNINTAIITNNNNLSCISVDNPADANNHTGIYSNWILDSDVNFSLNCSLNLINSFDKNFKILLNNGILSINSDIKIKEIQIFDVVGRKLKSVTNKNSLNINSIKNKVIIIKIITEKNNIKILKMLLVD